MDELIPRVLGYLRAVWSHRRLGVFVAWAVSILAAGVILRMPDKYEASARIFVDTQSILKPLMSGLTVLPNMDQQIMMLSRTLITRPNVEKIIRMADLDLENKSPAAREEMIERLLKTLEIKSATRDNLYTLSFRDSRQDHARKIIQAALSIFVESSLGEKRQDSDSALRFIEDQIKVYEKKLEEAETRLKEFKLRNVEFQFAEGRASPDRFSESMSQLNTAKLALREAENSRDVLKQQLEGQVQASSKPNQKLADRALANPEIDGRLDSMKRNLDSMLQKYTDEHPDVVGARRVIKDLEEQRAKEIAAMQKAGGGVSAAAANPVREKLTISLAETEANIASLRARVSEYDSRVAAIKNGMKNLPLVEAEFSQLNRDYDVQKKNYEQLVSRRESASLTGNLEAAGGGADFRLIDPPRVNPKPVAPNRTLLLAGALAASIIAGLAAAFLASQIRPVYFDAKSLRDETNLPILGTISLSLNGPMKQKEMQSMRRVFIAVGAMVAVYAIGIGYMAYRSILGG